MDDVKILVLHGGDGQIKPVEQVPIAYRQIGWQKCIACSDSRTRPGEMWLGMVNGRDNYITCPECKGTQKVPRYQVIDTRTGKEIDYEVTINPDSGNPIHYVPIKNPMID